MNSQEIKEIKLLAGDIEVNGNSVASTTLSLSVNEYAEWNSISGNATLGSSLVIQPTGTPTGKSIFKFLYDATMVLSGNTITIFGYSVPTALALKKFMLIAKWDVTAAAWDVHVFQYFAVDLPTGTIVGTSDSQTLSSKIIQSSRLDSVLIDDSDAGVTLTSADQTHATPTVTIPDIVDAADSFLMNDTQADVTNKIFKASTVVFGDQTDTTKKVGTDISGATTGKKTTLAFVHTDNRTITFPNATDTLVGKATSDIFTNKSIDGATNTLTNVGVGSQTNAANTFMMAVTVDLGSTHDVKLLMNGKYEVVSDAGAVQACLTIAQAGGGASTIMLQDNSANDMFAAPMQFDSGNAAGTIDNETASTNNTLNDGDNLIISITSAGTGTAVITIPLRRIT